MAKKREEKKKGEDLLRSEREKEKREKNPVQYKKLKIKKSMRERERGRKIKGGGQRKGANLKRGG